MKSLLILLLLSLITFNCYSQKTKKYHLAHLQPSEFEEQLKLCSDSAYLDFGINKPQGIYINGSYSWLVTMLNNEARKYFQEFKSDKAPDHLFQYRFSWERNGKDLLYNLCLNLDGKLLGKTPVLYTSIGDQVVITVRFHRSKREINMMIKEAIQKTNQ